MSQFADKEEASYVTCSDHCVLLHVDQCKECVINCCDATYYDMEVEKVDLFYTA